MKLSSTTNAVLLIAALFFVSTSLFADEWITDYKTATAQAKKENKMVLMDFSGSDWCGGCMKLDKEVFSTSEFKKYAKKNLVLLKVDFPFSKPQSDELKQQNEALKEHFNVEGYPTIIVLDPKGRPIGQLGYIEGGPKEFLTKLNKLKK